MARFSDQIIAAVRVAPGTYAQIAQQFGMSISHVGDIRRGETRTDDEVNELLAPEVVSAQ
jgi:hypothetical protein